MRDKCYICKYADNCENARTKNCTFGIPTLKNILDKRCGGSFRPRLTIHCDHPKVNAGVLLIEIRCDHIEGNCSNIWT